VGVGVAAGGADAAALRGHPLFRRGRDQRRQPDRTVVGHVGLRHAGHRHLPLQVGGLGRGDHRQHPGFGFGNHHPAADRRHSRVVDGERRGADDDLLRAEDPAPLVLPGCLVRHLRGRFADDRQFVDDDRLDAAWR